MADRPRGIRSAPGASLVQQDGPAIRGTTAIRQRLAEFVAIEPVFSSNVIKVIQADDDLAVLYSDWTVTAKGPDGNPLSLSGKGITVVRRQPDGTWKLAMDDPFARN